MALNRKGSPKVVDEQEYAPMTSHARTRMHQRSVSATAVEAAFAYGREVHTRGATVYAIGRREVRKATAHGEDLGAFEGVQVVCGRDGAVITVYRNRDFKGLRPGLGRFHMATKAA